MQNESSNMKYSNKPCHIKWSQSLNESGKGWKDDHMAAGQISPLDMVEMWKQNKS